MTNKPKTAPLGAEARAISVCPRPRNHQDPEERGCCDKCIPICDVICEAEAALREKMQKQINLLRGFPGFHQRCNRCGRADGTNFHTEDTVWKGIAGEEYQHKVLCYACFDTLAGEKGLKYTVHDLCFAGEQGHSTDALKAQAGKEAVEKEREACANIAEGFDGNLSNTALAIAADIRARG